MKITEIYAKLDAVLESQTDSKYDYICHEFPLETKTPFSICKFLNFCRHIKNVKLKDIKNENNESLECSVYITKEEQFLALGQVLCPIASKNISTTAHFEDYFRKLLKKSPQNSVFIAALAFFFFFSPKNNGNLGEMPTCSYPKLHCILKTKRLF